MRSASTRQLTFLNAYAEYYPANSPMQRTISAVRDQIRQAQQAPVRLQVSIVTASTTGRRAARAGWTIDPTGTVSYACDPQFVHDARCDRATFPSGTFTYKTVADPEQLHLTTARAISTSSPPSRQSPRPSGPSRRRRRIQQNETVAGAALGSSPKG